MEYLRVAGHEGNVTEPIAILDVFCTELVQIEDLGNGIRRLIFSTPHAHPDGRVTREVVARLILPAACLVQVSRRMLQGADEVISDLLMSVPNHLAQ